MVNKLSYDIRVKWKDFILSYLTINEKTLQAT